MGAGRGICLVDAESFSDAEVVSAVCLQGLANREEPRVFLTLRRRHCHSSFESNPLSADAAARLPADVLSRYRSAPEFWQARYAEAHGYAFAPVAGLMALLDEVAGQVKGVIRFSLANRCELPLAVMLAGLEDAVAVPDESPHLDAFLARLPVLADVRGRFTTRWEASCWALRELMPRCNHRAVFSQNDTNDQRDADLFSLDLAVAERMFVFNLDFWQARAPRHFALIQDILACLEPMSPMYGWGTSEAAMMVAMGPSSTFLICAGCPNLSFHKKVPLRHGPLRARRRFRPEDARLENRHYVTFMVNEGDTLKWMGSVMGAGRWLEPERGQLPVNWGISPFIDEHFPGLMEYFYESSGEQDVLVSSISGYGYYGLKHCRQARELAEREGRLLPPAGVTVGSVYAVHGMLEATRGELDAETDDWLVRRGCAGYLFESAQQHARWVTSAGQPLLGADWSMFYWKYRIPGEGEAQLRGVADRIRALAREKTAPSFIPVYGGSPSDFARIAAYLPADEFKVVGLDEMVALARLAGAPAPAPQSPAPAPVPRPFAGRLVRAAGITGAAREPVVLDLGAFAQGRMKAQVSFAWDPQHLTIYAEELAGPARPCEAQQQAGYAAGEFDQADGVALWFDFDLDGTCERGDFTLWLGFSSLGRPNLSCSMLNDRVLAGVFPPVVASTQVCQGLRRIEARVAWSDLERALEARRQPAPSLTACIRPGFVFACQPLLVEGRAGRAFLNGRSNRRENGTAAALEDQRVRSSLPMPDGFDAASLRVRLD